MFNDNHRERSSFYEHTNPENARRIIDEDISKHEKSIISLKSLRNTFSPISKIPAEILAQIFYFVGHGLTYPTPLDWIKVSYVSRQWRNVAINSANLWTNLPLDYRRWTEEMLERSKMASLIVNVNFGSASYSAHNQVALALCHIERVKALTLDYTSVSTLKKLTPHLSKSAPRLQTLVISVRADVSRNDTYKLPTGILCEAGNLRRLELTGCNISWDFPLLSSLSHLKIYNVSLTARPTTEELLELLSRMPNLKHLDLRGALPIDGNHSLSVQRVIPLHQLRFLSLSSTATEIPNLLQHISFLPTTTITIVVTATPDSQSDFSAVISTLSSILCPSDNTGLDIRSFVIESTGEHDSWIRARTFSDVDLSRLNSTTPIVDLTFKPAATQNGTSEESFRALVPQLFHALPLSNLGKLFLLLEDYQPDPQTLANTFGTLTRLHSIFATGSSTTEFLLEALLCKPVPEHSEATLKSRKNALSFPGLLALSLQDVTFYSEEYDGLSIESLIDCLIARYELGGEVRELHLADCTSLFKDNVQALKEIVVNVQWDQVVQKPPEDDAFYDRDDYDYDEGDEGRGSDYSLNSDYHYDSYHSFGFFW